MEAALPSDLETVTGSNNLMWQCLHKLSQKKCQALILTKSFNMRLGMSHCQMKMNMRITMRKFSQFLVFADKSVSLKFYSLYLRN